MVTNLIQQQVLESLVIIEGTLDNPLINIRFENISFQHTTWMRPSKEGHVPLQAGWSIVDAYKLQEPGTPDKASLENQAWIERQPAALEVSNARNIETIIIQASPIWGNAFSISFRELARLSNSNICHSCFAWTIYYTAYYRQGYWGFYM